MFCYATTVKLHDTDAAGLLFFGNQFRIAHDAYESLMTEIGFSFARILRRESFFIPIAHAEADFKRALFVGDSLTVELTVEKLGDSSFTLAHRLLAADGGEAGTVKTVHVCVDRETQRPTPIPPSLREKLANV